jgi:ankyrin repeat protein
MANRKSFGRSARIRVYWRKALGAAVICVLVFSISDQSVHATSAAAVMTSASNVFFPSGLQASLEQAIRANDVVAIKRSIAAGAQVNARGKNQATPLMIAVDVQVPDAVEALLELGADPNAKAIDGNSPVSLATESYRAKPHGREVMMAVLNGGGDANARRTDGDPVITRFINDHNVADIKLLKSLGADLDILDRSGRPLITSVAMGQDWDVVWTMIELGAKYDYENGKSMQPLSEALGLAYPAPDSPLYPYKLKVWQLMKDKGLPVKPMKN